MTTKSQKAIGEQRRQQPWGPKEAKDRHKNEQDVVILSRNVFPFMQVACAAPLAQAFVEPSFIIELNTDQMVVIKAWSYSCRTKFPNKTFNNYHSEGVKTDNSFKTVEKYIFTTKLFDLYYDILGI